MSNSLVHAFFVGRALAQAMGEQVEKTLTNALSELGKFDAEQREQLRVFTNRVIELADAAEADAMQGRPTSNTGWQGNVSPVAPIGTGDLQATIDELRAEIAHVRAELQRYRTKSM